MAFGANSKYKWHFRGGMINEFVTDKNMNSEEGFAKKKSKIIFFLDLSINLFLFFVFCDPWFKCYEEINLLIFLY